MDEAECWTCTIVRAHGLQLMRPERSWRPIVTIEVDKTGALFHETVLGSDGQNVNMKDVFRLHGADLASQVDVKIFHRSQSKKKGKKKTLVASCTCSLGEMWKRDGINAKLELRLQCQNPTNRSVASRGRPQKGALLHLKLRPPPSFPSPTELALAEDEEGYDSDSSSASSSCTVVTPTVAEVRPQPTLRRRRRVRGYAVNSDEEAESYSETDDDDPELDEVKPFNFDGEDRRDVLSAPVKILFSPIAWVAAQLLPQYSAPIPISPYPPSYNFAQRTISTFTRYSELQDARTESKQEQIYDSIRSEWAYTAGFLGTLSGVNAAIFSLSPDSLFEVSPLAEKAVVAGIIAAVLGIVSTAWLWLRYGYADCETFFRRATDILSVENKPSFFFFALSARIPGLLSFISGGGLLLFFIVIAWNSWPAAVVVGCFGVGLLMGLQWLVFCVLWSVRTARKVWRFLAGRGPAKDEDVSEKC
ncbi:hypothetical protein MIND_00945800 [Mycena indigotica]|uniref:C2 domain-containing protein n=1 Tax=Mycena indigotica TaxID=2126181 RepID=A0A8H6W2N2_9AGAR|nr:uncharacterized protein MIND_00945800 [Mycena indigotica]KAF7297129.1 hypothetical protein MIND_00945800 [Mycena indigotica]